MGATVKASIAAPITVIGAVILAVMATLALAVADLRGDATTRLLWTWAGRLWTGLCGLLPLLLAVAFIAGLWSAAAWARNRAALVYHRRGLLPASANPSFS